MIDRADLKCRRAPTPPAVHLLRPGPGWPGSASPPASSSAARSAPAAAEVDLSGYGPVHVNARRPRQPPLAGFAAAVLLHPRPAAAALPPRHLRSSAPCSPGGRPLPALVHMVHRADDVACRIRRRGRARRVALGRPAAPAHAVVRARPRPGHELQRACLRWQNALLPAAGRGHADGARRGGSEAVSGPPRRPAERLPWCAAPQMAAWKSIYGEWLARAVVRRTARDFLRSIIRTSSRIAVFRRAPRPHAPSFSAFGLAGMLPEWARRILSRHPQVAVGAALVPALA